MGKKPGRKNQNRPARPARPPKRQRATLPELHPDVAQAPQRKGTVRVRAIAHEDSVLPVPLKFPPPLAELATNKQAFDYNWQLMTYAFELEDPLDIPPLPSPLDPAEQRKLARFIEVSEKVAQYSVVSSKGGLKVDFSNGDMSVESVTADDEALVGFSVRFRQLHDSDSGDPCFGVVQGILMKAAKNATDERAAERMEILTKWSRARGQLLNHPLKNIVATKVLTAGNCPNPSEFANYRDVDPQKIISLFNYGEKIHHGKHADEFGELEKDQFKHDYAEHEFITSMLGLVHLYFGYSLLIRAAAGFACVREGQSA
ncbi:hypothetical protein [Rhodococcus daqingensis]|uniref:Uncharacterized protein n=1 Tax=Rhodococcus daqingensis TaxID=2479363 RepID=A0ABW2S3P4_9NOCA